MPLWPMPEAPQDKLLRLCYVQARIMPQSISAVRGKTDFSIRIYILNQLISATFVRCIGFLGLGLGTSLVCALDLGPLHWRTAAGQPAYAEVELRNTVDSNPAAIRASLATPEAYATAGLAYHPGFATLKIGALNAASGQTVIKIEQLPQDAESLDLLLVVSNRQTVALAEYRVFTGNGAQDIPPSPAGALQFKVRSAKVETRASATLPESRSIKPAPVTAVDVDAEAAREAILAWAKAWSARDVETYVAAYTADYPGPGSKQNHADWLAQRRKLIETRKQIAVDIDALRLERRGETFVASFRQRYRGDGFSDVSHKRVELVRDNGRWLIRQERTLLPLAAKPDAAAAPGTSAAAPTTPASSSAAE